MTDSKDLTPNKTLNKNSSTARGSNQKLPGRRIGDDTLVIDDVEE